MPKYPRRQFFQEAENGPKRRSGKNKAINQRKLMDFLFDAFLSFLLVYKYAALFAITFVAALILPLPASTTIVAANVFAFQGYLNFPAVFCAALLGNIAGDNLGNFISRNTLNYLRRSEEHT